MRAVESPLILKRASASRPSGEWNDDDFDVLADGAVVGRILKVHGAPVGTPWMWTTKARKGPRLSGAKFRLGGSGASLQPAPKQKHPTSDPVRM